MLMAQLMFFLLHPDAHRPSDYHSGGCGVLPLPPRGRTSTGVQGGDNEGTWGIWIKWRGGEVECMVLVVCN
jgi:hypothetical protein